MATQQNPEPENAPEHDNHQESRSTRIINRALYTMALFSIFGLLAMSLPLERMLQPPPAAEKAAQQAEPNSQTETAEPDSQKEETEQSPTSVKPALSPALRWITRGKVAVLLIAALSITGLLIAHRFATGWQSFTERPVHTTVNLLAALAEHPTGLPLRLIIQAAAGTWDRYLHPVWNRIEPVIGDFIMLTFLQERMNRVSEQSRAEGLAEGRAEGVAEGRAEGVSEILDQMVREGILTPEQRAEKEAQYRADDAAQKSNHDRE